MLLERIYYHEACVNVKIEISSWDGAYDLYITFWCYESKTQNARVFEHFSCEIKCFRILT